VTRRFTRADMVEQAWRIVQPVLDAWTTERHACPTTTLAEIDRQQLTNCLRAMANESGGPVTTSLEQTS
jgi:glucose-6-phosphate 1-dehydrogenase